MTIKELQVISTKFLFVCILIGVTGCQGTSKVELVKHIPRIEVDKKELVLNQLEGRWYYNNERFNGFAISYHKNGIKAESIGYYEGKKEGIAKKWFDTNAPQKESHYKANKLVGTTKSWWPNGMLSSESHYVDGTRHGIQKRWHANGQLSMQMTIVNGKEEGLQQAWLENGKIYVNYEAKNGRTFGLRKAKLCYELEDEIVQY